MTDKTLPNKLFPFILFFVKRYKFHFFGMSLVMVLWAINVSLSPYLIKLILDVVEQSSTDSVISNSFYPVLSYIGLSLFMVFALRVYNYLDLNSIPAIRRDIVYELSTNILSYSHTYFQNKFSGTISNKIIYIAEGIYKIVNLIIERFFGVLIALCISLFAFYSVDYKLSLVVGTWIFVYLVITVLCAKKTLHLSEILGKAETNNTGHIVDLLSNSISVRLFARYAYESKVLGKKLDETVKKDMDMLWFVLKVYLLQGVSYVVMLSITLYLLLLERELGNVTIGDFGLVLTLEISIIEILWELSKDCSDFAIYLGDISQGLDLITHSEQIKEEPGAKELEVEKGCINFENVTFHYKGATPLFENLSINIPGGQKVGLVGFSGSGKTTFLNLIMRLYDLQEGTIYIDGQDIKNISKKSLREELSIIPQTPVLFHRTLMENIRYGDLNATDEQVIEASRKAYVHEFVDNMPGRYDSMVGERGSKLSGGQLQRVAIARAILKGSPILLLDEVTSGLDSVTESLIQSAFDNLMEGKTTLVIAHRLSTLLHMDRILVFDKGKIVEDGSHDELLRANGIYTKLWNSQIGGYIQG